MEFLKIFIIVVISIYLLSMLILSARCKKAFKLLFLNAIIGIFVLLILYFTKKYTGISLAINKFTVSVSSIFGIVGVIGLLFFNLII